MEKREYQWLKSMLELFEVLVGFAKMHCYVVDAYQYLKYPGFNKFFGMKKILYHN
jgi:hypothetical protein